MQSHFSNDASTIEVSQMRFKSLSPDASSNELRSAPNVPFTVQSQTRHPLLKVNSQPRNPNFGNTVQAYISNENSMILA